MAKGDASYRVTIDLPPKLYQFVAATARREHITISESIVKRISQGQRIRAAMKNLRVFQDRYVGTDEGTGIIISALNQMAENEIQTDKPNTPDKEKD